MTTIIRPGDTVVLQHTARQLDMATVNLVTQHWAARSPNTHVVILGSEWNVTAVARPSRKRSSRTPRIRASRTIL